MAIDLSSKRTIFEGLKEHLSHDVDVVSYGRGEIHNVAIECETCGEVLVDADNPDIYGEE